MQREKKGEYLWLYSMRFICCLVHNIIRFWWRTNTTNFCVYFIHVSHFTKLSYTFFYIFIYAISAVRRIYPDSHLSTGHQSMIYIYRDDISQTSRTAQRFQCEFSAVWCSVIDFAWFTYLMFEARLMIIKLFSFFL